MGNIKYLWSIDLKFVICRCRSDFVFSIIEYYDINWIYGYRQ